MSFATVAIAALLSTAAVHPTNSSSEQQPAQKERRPTCCDQMRNCAGMHAKSAAQTTDGVSDVVSSNGA